MLFISKFLSWKKCFYNVWSADQLIDEVSLKLEIENKNKKYPIKNK